MADEGVLGPTFDEYITGVRELWAREPDAERVAMRVRELMEQLLQKTPPEEPWVERLWAERDRVRARRLYVDPEFGFIQMGHYHVPGHSRPPHDHGPHWVVYGVYRGAIEIPTYRKVKGDSDGRLELIRREAITAGKAQAYLTGDIHSTRALSDDGAIVLRFLSADLEQARVSRYRWEQIAAQ